MNLLEKFAYSIWGITMIDFIPFIDLSFLSDVNSGLKGLVAVFGAIYFIIQIVFKTIELNHKRKYNNTVRKIQEEDLRIKERERDYLELRKDYHTTK